MSAPDRGFEWRPLTPERWSDFEQLFGKSGASSGCWCMWFRQTGKEYTAGQGKPNHDAMCAIVESGQVPGLVGYVDSVPAAWISLGPRDEYPRLERSRAARRVDDAAVWSIVCFFIGRRFRGQGLMQRMLDAALEYAREQGATVVEAYPKDIDVIRPSKDAAYVGLMPTFVAGGFTEVARPANGRPLMRRSL